jgi:hypothetical protein
MLLNRDEIREDKYFHLLTEAILERISHAPPIFSSG